MSNRELRQLAFDALSFVALVVAVYAVLWLAGM